MPDEQNTAPAAAPAAAEADRELQAMNAVVAALKPLQDNERKRVLEYVLGRFGTVPLQTSLATATEPLSAPPTTSLSVPAFTGAIHDIRSLRAAKNPRSAIEMAALVAFYVSELAPEGERKNTISNADIERHFKSAQFHLPSDAAFTLVNAKNAGYLDNVGSGQYKLNPVGYNLVAHRMGSREKNEPRRPPTRKARRGLNKEANERREQ
jgi:hypothetical protein